MSAKKTARKSGKASKTASKKASATASASAKHTAHEKHLAHEAHLKAAGKVTTKAKPAAHAKAKKVAFAVGDHLPVCSFEAVAMSLRLAGRRVHGDEVAALWELCGAAEATTIEDALEAAARFGLAGYRPRLIADGVIDDFAGKLAPGDLGDDLAVVPVGNRVVPHLGGIDAEQLQSLTDFADGVGDVHALILGIDRPGPHAVLATADGWWSWGELYSPWPARIEEAWVISWS